MGKVVSIHTGAQGAPKAKLPTPDSQQPVQDAEVDYLNSLQPLVDEAKRLSRTYDIGAKDVLTDALCLLIESAILDECAQYDPDPVG